MCAQTHTHGKESKHKSKNHYCITREESKIRRKEWERTIKTIPKQFLKMAINTHLSIISSDINILNAPAKRHG